MTDETIVRFRGGERASDPHGQTADVMFDRRELGTILSVYGRMVSCGEWRDYAIGMGSEMAVFAVFRHSSEAPVYRIEKRPKLRVKQGQFCVVAAGGHILKRGNELSRVLQILEPSRPQLVE